jgi:hypothetical protein
MIFFKKDKFLNGNPLLLFMATKRIQIALPNLESEEDVKGLNDHLGNYLADVNEISKWFKNYNIDSIELSIGGVIETLGVLKLVLNAKGEGGLKVTLKPKKEQN